MIRGRTAPRLQGWYAEAYGKWEPGITRVFRSAPGTARVETQLELRPKQP